MASKKHGSRYRLLLYRRAMNRLWRPALLLAAILLWMWWQGLAGTLLEIQPPWDMVLMGSALLVGAIGLFALFTRNMSYVQVYNNHLRLVTPFLRLVISFRRIERMYPTQFSDLFPVKGASWGERRFLSPFYTQTVLVVSLLGYPLSPAILRFFLPKQMFSPRQSGFVVLVSDWMKFNQEFDSTFHSWQQKQHEQMRRSGFPGGR